MFIEEGSMMHLNERRGGKLKADAQQVTDRQN